MFNLRSNLFADASTTGIAQPSFPNGNPQPGPHTLYSVGFANGKFVGVGDSGTPYPSRLA